MNPHRLRHIVRESTRQLPAAALSRPELREMAGHGCITVMHLMRLVAPRLPDDDDTDPVAELATPHWFIIDRAPGAQGDELG